MSATKNSSGGEYLYEFDTVNDENVRFSNSKYMLLRIAQENEKYW